MSRFLLILILCLPLWVSAQKDSKKKNSNPKPRKVILLIGDGMGTAQIYAGIVARKDATNLERMNSIGFSKTNASNKFITDSAAGATALSIGQKTYNGAIGVDSNGKSVPTILEIAEKAGYATGLVATSTITHATPASFIAHVASRKQEDDIALDFLKTDIDVFIGGGKNYFANRKDKRNLLDELKAKKYQIANTEQEMKAIHSGKLAALLADEALKPAQPNLVPTEGMYKDTSLNHYTPRGILLEDAAMKAIELLDKNPKGYFLMIEGSQIDWGGHANNLPYVISEQVDFDNVIGKVLYYAEKDGNTLVIVTADHETGGLAITGGNLKEGKVEGKFISTEHTATMVPVFAYGPGASTFQGIYPNTAIYFKMMKALGLK